MLLEITNMTFRNLIRSSLLGFLTITLLLLTSANSSGQTRTRPPAPPIAIAQVPFDFWVDDTQLPAGEYGLYPALGLDIVLLLRNTRTNAQEQLFLVPTGESVAKGDYKLVFVTRAGQNHLCQVWETDGKAVLTSQYGIGVRSTDARSEVPLVTPSAH
jgi:hypothetical protein